MYVVGLMSGTSSDGVDAAVVSIRRMRGRLRVKPVAFQTLAYPPRVRARVLAAAESGTVQEICHLNVVLGEWFARAALESMQAAGLSPEQVFAIGSHGQTIQHRPEPRWEPGLGRVRSTFQIGEPAVIAERTGVTTVANFRPRDMAAEGEGAPLTPAVHELLLTHPSRSRLIVNLGGIANVTYLPPERSRLPRQAFDTGPGNMVLDELAAHLTDGRRRMDRDGKMARHGQVHEGLLKDMLAHPFIQRTPPKSSGREAFGKAFVSDLIELGRRRRIPAPDLLATCTRLTAQAVGTARRWLGGPIDEVIVGGGGVRNRTLMEALADSFHPTPVQPMDAVGWTSLGFEAIAFAVLAYQTLQGEYGTIPGATGAKHPVVLGHVTPGDSAWIRRLCRNQRPHRASRR